MATTLETQPDEIREPQPQPELAPDVRALLGGLRQRIRWYVWIEGLAVAVAWLGLAFWSSLAIDWLLELPQAVRGCILAVVLVVLAALLFRRIGLRAFVPLSDSNMATLLERRFSEFDDSLLTAVVLTAPEHGEDPCDPEMLAHTCREAALRTGDVRLRWVFNPLPLVISVCAAVLLTISVAVFLGFCPEPFGIWAERNLLLSAEEWPRTTRMVVEGFDENGVARVAKGADFPLVAKADLSEQYEVVPETAYVNYRVEGGSWTSDPEPMARQGNAVRGQDEFQKYTYTFENVMAPIDLEVIGGDDRIRDLRIEVVPRPHLEEKLLTYHYPSYMQREHSIEPERVTGTMRVPVGTEVTVIGRSDKDLAEVRFEKRLVTVVGTEEQEQVSEWITMDDLGGKREFQQVLYCLSVGRLEVRYVLVDTDNVTNRKPDLLVLDIYADAPPVFRDTRLDGIEEAITPKARLPVTGTVSDDHGLGAIWFEYLLRQKQKEGEAEADPPAEDAAPEGAPEDAAAGDPEPPKPMQSPKTPIGAKTFELDLLSADVKLEVEDLALQPGQLITLCVKASDRYDLDGADPNETSSHFWTLEVVTEDELRKMLEWSELMARQQFEAIIDKMTEAREKLDVDFDATDPPEGVPAGADTPQTRLDFWRSEIGAALHNTQQMTAETESVAERFDQILKQFINNQITADLEQLTIRLQDGIAKPLHDLSDTALPELAERLEALKRVMDDPTARTEQLERARDEADAILTEMQKILKRMLELQTFNEAVETLREIRKELELIRELTKKRRNQKLLEED